MKIGNAVGFAVAALVGGGATLGWALSLWLALSGAPSEATRQGAVITGEFELVE